MLEWIRDPGILYPNPIKTILYFWYLKYQCWDLIVIQLLTQASQPCCFPGSPHCSAPPASPRSWTPCWQWAPPPPAPDYPAWPDSVVPHCSWHKIMTKWKRFNFNNECQARKIDFQPLQVHYKEIYIQNSFACGWKVNWKCKQGTSLESSLRLELDETSARAWQFTDSQQPKLPSRQKRMNLR